MSNKEREIEFVRYGRVTKRKQIKNAVGRWVFKPSKREMNKMHSEALKENPADNPDLIDDIF